VVTVNKEIGSQSSRNRKNATDHSKKMRRELWNIWTMDVIADHFSTEHKDMFAHCKIKLEKALVGINPKFDKLITALTAVDNEGSLDKEATSYDDIFDPYRSALEFYHHKVRLVFSSEISAA
jgi:hypothetical protein